MFTGWSQNCHQDPWRSKTYFARVWYNVICFQECELGTDWFKSTQKKCDPELSPAHPRQPPKKYCITGNARIWQQEQSQCSSQLDFWFVVETGSERGPPEYVSSIVVIFLRPIRLKASPRISLESWKGSTAHALGIIFGSDKLVLYFKNTFMKKMQQCVMGVRWVSVRVCLIFFCSSKRCWHLKEVNIVARLYIDEQLIFACVFVYISMHISLSLSLSAQIWNLLPSELHSPKSLESLKNKLCKQLLTNP